MNTFPTKVYHWILGNSRVWGQTQALTTVCLQVYVLFDNRFWKKVLIFLLVTPFLQSDLDNNEKYAGKVQSELQTGELFLDIFHEVLYRFWNCCVKNTTSEKMGLSSHKEKLVFCILGPTFYYSPSCAYTYSGFVQEERRRKMIKL